MEYSDRCRVAGVLLVGTCGTLAVEARGAHASMAILATTKLSAFFFLSGKSAIMKRVA